MGKTTDSDQLIERLAEDLDTSLAVGVAEFFYPAHEPEWLEAGGARVCLICGMVNVDDPRGPEPGGRLATGVIRRGGPRLSDEDEEFYRQEKQS